MMRLTTPAPVSGRVHCLSSFGWLADASTVLLQ
jgi:hypothetical protein